MSTPLTEINKEDRAKAVDSLISHSTPDSNFFLMVLLSVLMAAFGLLKGSAAVVIGAMLIAPFLYPVLSFAMGVVMSDKKLMSRSFSVIIKATIYSIVASFVVSLFFGFGTEINSEILLRTGPSLLDAAIAIIAGLAASFAMAKPGMNETLPGIAIAVALVPPLATVGIGLSKFSWTIASGAFITFLLNVVGIVLTSIAVFSLMNFHNEKRLADVAIKEEDKKLKGPGISEA